MVCLFWCALQPWVMHYQQFWSVSQLPDPLPESCCLTRAITPPLFAVPSHTPNHAETSTAVPVQKTHSTRVCFGASLVGSALQLIPAAFWLCLHSRLLHCTQIPASHTLYCPLTPFHPAPYLSTTSSVSPKAPWITFGYTFSTLSSSLAPRFLPYSPTLYFPYLSNSFPVDSATRIYILLPEPTLARTCLQV